MAPSATPRDLASAGVPNHMRSDVNTASLGERPPRRRSLARAEESPDELNDRVFVIKASPRVGGYRLWSGMERDGRRHASFALDTLHEDDNHTSIHTGSVVARVTKDRAFCRTPGQKWKVCDWCTNPQDPCQKQHHHWHLKCENTKSTWQSRTNV